MYNLPGRGSDAGGPVLYGPAQHNRPRIMYGWDNANNRAVESWPDGSCAVTGYDQLDRPTVNLFSGSLAPCGNWSLMWVNSYDQVGRLFSQATGNGGGTGYTFAEPDVLVSGVVNLLQPNGSGGYNWNAAYTYGYTKERQEQSRTTAGMAPLAHPASAGTVTYRTPSNVNEIPGVSGGATFTYNANGNLPSDGVRIYTYDKQGDGHIISATGTGLNTTYAYDPFGQRFSKTDNTQNPAVTTYYLHDDRGNEIGEYDGNWHLLRRGHAEADRLRTVPFRDPAWPVGSVGSGSRRGKLLQERPRRLDPQQDLPHRFEMRRA